MANAWDTSNKDFNCNSMHKEKKNKKTKDTSNRVGKERRNVVNQNRCFVSERGEKRSDEGQVQVGSRNSG